ncbi:MAG: tyrosine-type recombinase/integrase, partial [Polyangiaceae bacterium]
APLVVFAPPRGPSRAARADVGGLPGAAHSGEPDSARVVAARQDDEGFHVPLARRGCELDGACRAVPLVRRLFFGVLEREGMRREEAADLRWSDVDLARGVVRLDENKTDDPRAWALDAGVAAALGIWRSRFQADVAEDAHVFRHAGKPPLRRPDGGASAGRPQGRRRDPLRAL